MQRPNVDDDLTLLTDFGKTEAIVVEVLDNPATEEGVLLKVMTRGSFEQGQQVWIVDRDGSKVGATVENVVQQTIDSEVTLSTRCLRRSDVGRGRCADQAAGSAASLPPVPLHAGLLSAPLFTVIKLWPPLPIT